MPILKYSNHGNILRQKVLIYACLPTNLHNEGDDCEFPGKNEPEVLMYTEGPSFNHKKGKLKSYQAIVFNAVANSCFGHG